MLKNFVICENKSFDGEKQKKMSTRCNFTRHLFITVLPQKRIVLKNKQNSEHLYERLMALLFCFRCFSKKIFWFLTFYKGGKSDLQPYFGGKFFFLQNFIFYHPYESINVYSAVFLSF